MSRGRRRARPTTYQRLSRWVAPLITVGVIAAGIVAIKVDVLDGGANAAATAAHEIGATGSAPGDTAPDAAAAALSQLSLAEREQRVSRAAGARLEPAPKPLRPKAPKAIGTKWATETLAVRAAAKADARTFGDIAAFDAVAVTGRSRNGFAEIVVDKKARWVTERYLVEEKPTSPDGLPISGQACPGTAGVERGLTAGAIRVYRAVCTNFPEITRYGGRAGRGEHGTGKALDIMTTNVALGNRIAEYLKANAAAFNLFDVIWRQRIFTQQRAGEGWRPMSNRGSATANHFDHIHVKVN